MVDAYVIWLYPIVCDYPLTIVIIIYAWVSALLVQTIGAVRKPEMWDELMFEAHVFFVYIDITLSFTPSRLGTDDIDS